jgi:hypothetical protein
MIYCDQTLEAQNKSKVSQYNVNSNPFQIKRKIRHGSRLFM